MSLKKKQILEYKESYHPPCPSPPQKKNTTNTITMM